MFTSSSVRSARSRRHRRRLTRCGEGVSVLEKRRFAAVVGGNARSGHHEQTKGVRDADDAQKALGRHRGGRSAPGSRPSSRLRWPLRRLGRRRAAQAKPANTAADDLRHAAGGQDTPRRPGRLEQQPDQLRLRLAPLRQRTAAAAPRSAGRNTQNYTLTSADVGNTVRFRVRAKNDDGQTTATSVPTAVIRRRRRRPRRRERLPAGGNPNQVSQMSLPAKLILDQFQSVAVDARRWHPVVRAAVHVTSTCGGPVQGALVYGTPTPFNQFGETQSNTGVRRLGDAHLQPPGELPGERQAADPRDVPPREQAGRERPRRHHGLLASSTSRSTSNRRQIPKRRGPFSGAGRSSCAAPRRHNRPVTHRQPDPAPGADPERGFVVAVLPKGADPEEELAEIRELARTAGVEPVATLVQPRAPARPAHLRRQGEARGAEARVRRVGRRVAARRRRARPGPAAAAGEPPRGARRRPDAADPRHLRPARAQRRGQAPGRARAAGVQPAADARHVAAPRAARRRRRDARPRRVAARDRPPARAPAGLPAQGAAERARQAARDAPQGAAALRDADDRACRLHERRQVDAPERAHRAPRRRVNDRLFETLDPTTRWFEHDGRRYLVTDTVGFIRRLPHQLVEGFAATLEETLVADLVLHVADASAPERAARRAAAGRQRRARRDRRRRAAGRARPEQDRRGRRAGPQAAREPVPGGAAGLRADRGGARRAPGEDRRAASPTASRWSSCSCRTPRAASSPSCMRSARRSSRGSTGRTAS